MKLSRPLIAAALSSCLVLAACSGDETDPQTDPTDDSTEVSTTEDTPDATGASPTTEPTDGVDETTGEPPESTGEGPDATASPTSEPEPQAEAVVSIEEADEVAQELIDDAAEIFTLDPGDERNELLRATYAGPARDGMRGLIRLLRIADEPEDDETEELEANVLAISQPSDDDLEYIVAQTVPESEIPRLHLMVRSSDSDGFQIVWEGDMLPGAELGQFERRSQGSPVVPDDSELGETSLAAHQHLAELLDYPHPDLEAEMTSHGYTKEVRDQARSQASSVAEQATFEQSNSLLEDAVHTLELADGSVLSFAVTERVSDFEVRSGMHLQPPETFRAFVDDAELTESASLDWLVFSAIQVPQGDGSPVLVAVTEQIVDASGS